MFTTYPSQAVGLAIYIKLDQALYHAEMARKSPETQLPRIKSGMKNKVLKGYSQGRSKNICSGKLHWQNLNLTPIQP